MGKVTVVGGKVGMTVPSTIDPVFANNDWKVIVRACQKNIVPETWVVGDSKTMNIGGTDYMIDIIGKNHDDYADGSGKAPLTLQLHNCYGTTYKYHGYYNNTSYTGSWNNCEMRTTHLPAILALMPVEVQDGIREVNKPTSKYVSSPPAIVTTTTADKLFLLSEVEVFGAKTNSFKDEGTQYDYYKAGNSAIKTVNGTAQYWWLRSPYNDNTTYFCVCKSDGKCSYTNSYNAYGVAFAFCF